jgi:hypothetical protein
MNTTTTAAHLSQVETSASGIKFVRPLGNAAAKAVPNYVDKWRRENSDHVVRQEVESTGGAWVQFWGFRVYYGPCADCGGLVHTRRQISHKKDGRTNTGRWPKYCPECNRNRYEAHDAGASARMAALRKRRREAQLEQFRTRGMEPPQPGRPTGPGGNSTSQPREAWFRTVPNMSYLT